jgi:CheY-like chemotaxis protein
VGAIIASVLVVDDDEPNRYATSRALEAAGFRVTPAKGYEDALAIIKSAAPIDVFLTDVVMPAGVHGFALARMARMLRPNLKILYMTGYDVPTVEAVGKILRKPVSDDDLVREVRAALTPDG